MDRNQIVTLRQALEQCKELQTTLWNLVAEDRTSPIINPALTADLLSLDLRATIQELEHND